MRIYLDHNATSPLSEAARDAMARTLASAAISLGNPSSVHHAGRVARGLVEKARRQVAALVGAEPDEIVFTSGGTEADLLAIAGLAANCAAIRAILPVTEHPAVALGSKILEAGGGTVVRAATDPHGWVDATAFATACEGGGLATVALANHETGILQDIAALAAIARRAGALFHTDAVQAVGKCPVDLPALGVDTAAISAHKIGGPAGVGALYVRRNLHLGGVAGGGGQERGRRPGTENLLGIVGFGAAAEAARLELASRTASMAAARDALQAGLSALEGARVYGDSHPRICNTLMVSFDGALGETVVCALDIEGIAVSTGAACSSGTVKSSQVLLDLGVEPSRAAEAVRFSVGPQTTLEEVKRVLEVLPPIIARARAFR